MHLVWPLPLNVSSYAPVSIIHASIIVYTPSHETALLQLFIPFTNEKQRKIEGGMYHSYAPPTGEAVLLQLYACEFIGGKILAKDALCPVHSGRPRFAAARPAGGPRQAAPPRPYPRILWEPPKKAPEGAVPPTTSPYPKCIQELKS